MIALTVDDTIARVHERRLNKLLGGVIVLAAAVPAKARRWISHELRNTAALVDDMTGGGK